MNGEFHGKAVLVTGGTGFIGRRLADALLKQGATVVVLSRRASSEDGQEHKTIAADLTNPASLAGVCRGMNVVFHLGGHVHAVDRLDDKNERLIWQVTVEGTSTLVEESLKAGVKRFVFFSSVKAMGEGGETRLNETTECCPVTSYGRAKRKAEKIVLDAGQQGLSSTILRLPMVYGPGCKGNLPRMIQAAARGRFPPLPETGNKRSMVDVRDVVQAALLAVTSPMAAGKVYIVTDGQSYSTRQIYEWICATLGRPVPRWAVPLTVLRFAARIGDMIGYLSGRRFVLDTDALNKLTGSAWYSSEKISQELNYRPTHTLRDSLPEMVAEYRKKNG
jgi:nucleoside-diphosphate-sugar epimerase